MKSILFFYLIIFTLLTLVPIFSQKIYVDYKGHIHAEDTIIGRIRKGKLVTNSGQNIAHLSKHGLWIDKNGTELAKPLKNTQVIYNFDMVSDTFNIGEKMHTGLCKVTNNKGETILLLHNRYKQEAACAIHCLYINHCLPNIGKK